MWEMHVDQWEIWSQEGGGLAPLTDAQKRYLIDNSVDWHAHKGTKWICDQMLQQVFKDGEVVEWYNYGGLPYHFQVITRDANVDPVKQQQMIDAIMSVKNVRSWPDGFIRDRYFSDSGNLNVGSCVVQFINTYIKAIK
jgi:P2-related tail formation protein